MDRLSEMEAFAAVVDQGGFTGAAHKLGISKSAVSKHVSSLEARLGTRLLNRTTRRVNPTDLGLVYYDRVREALAAARDADASVNELQASPSGTLSLVVSSDFGTSVLSAVMGGFVSRYPDLNVDIVMTNRYVELISEGYDLALRLGSRPDSSLRSHRLRSYTRHIVGSPAYLAQHGVPQRIEDLGDHQLLHFNDHRTGPCWTVVSGTGETRIVRTPGRVTANNGTSLRAAALDGLGLAFLPEFLIQDDLAAGRLTTVLDSMPEQSLPLYAVYPPSRAVLPRVRAFVDYLTETLTPAFAAAEADFGVPVTQLSGRV